MFDFVRRHTKIMTAVLFVLVIPPFALFGIERYSSFNQSTGKVAQVDGQNITQTEWDAAHRQYLDQIRSNNPRIDLALLDTPAMKYATLERLVRERVLAAAVSREHLTTTDQRLATELQQDPIIASLRRADGSMDMEQYRRLVSAQGLTPEGFEANVRSNISSRQVLGGVIASELVSPAQADVTMSAFYERREARIVRFAPADFAGKLDPSDADLQAFYQAHVGRYQVPESARIEYVVLDLDSAKKGVSVSEQDLRSYYENNKNTLGTPEERRASHILINAPKDAPAADRAKAKEKATELLVQLRKAPGSFAEVARKSSQDDVSAPAGGDLGAFRDGPKSGIDPTITKAAYGLAKVGDISDVVESDFGYHIVQLTGLKPASVPPFEQLRAQLEDQWRTEQAQKQFGELADTFTNDVYEQSDSLKPVADRLKLIIQTADGVRHTPAPDATGALGNAKFLKALFATDALEKKRNTEAVEIGPSQMVSGRIVQYSPPHARPFDEVRNDVRAAFIAEQGAKLARQEGQARLQAWTAQPSSANDLPAAVTLSRDAAQSQPAALVEAVLRADPAKLPVFVGVDLGDQGYAIARVDKILPKADQTADAVSQGRDRYQQAWTSAEARQYYELLKARYKAAITVPAPAAPVINVSR